jgi:hypothetical protein
MVPRRDEGHDVFLSPTPLTAAFPVRQAMRRLPSATSFTEGTIIDEIEARAALDDAAAADRNAMPLVTAGETAADGEAASLIEAIPNGGNLATCLGVRFVGRAGLVISANLRKSDCV